MDCLDHGTKVASIIGTKTDTFSGVAPEVKPGVYKVSGCTQYMSMPSLINAIKMAAISHKIDITNMSLGILYDVNFAKAINDAAKLNIIIVVSAGNNERGILWDETLPSTLPSTISVGSANVEPMMSHWFTIKNPASKKFACSTTCTNMVHKLEDVNIEMATAMCNGLECKVAGDLN
jgi:hypothetical protein